MAKRKYAELEMFWALKLLRRGEHTAAEVTG